MPLNYFGESMPTPDNDAPAPAYYFIDADSIDPMWVSEDAGKGRPFEADMIGTSAAPPHYDGDVEAIDIIRDELGNDDSFARWCQGTALKYALRWGSKPGSTVDEDRDKMEFYLRMGLHVEHPDVIPDPRSGRKGFKPYVRWNQTGRLPADVCARVVAATEGMISDIMRGSPK